MVGVVKERVRCLYCNKRYKSTQEHGALRGWQYLDSKAVCETCGEKAYDSDPAAAEKMGLQDTREGSCKTASTEQYRKDCGRPVFPKIPDRSPDESLCLT
jgi:hypothetical protein